MMIKIIYFKNSSKTLKQNDSLSFFIQRIRDEAHRFAINSHRKKRRKEAIEYVFDEISGIGAKRKKMLLQHFGSIKNIRNANINELYDIKGKNKSLADQIYEFFNSH